MRLSYSTQSAAQTVADRIHTWMIAHSADYAASAAAGRTTAAMKPYQDKDASGNVIGTNWYINLKDRHLGALTDAEKASLT